MPVKFIKCVDCDQEFTFGEREQEFFKARGLAHDPKRCKDCRKRKRDQLPPLRSQKNEASATR